MGTDSLVAQNHDQVWLLGYNPNIPEDRFGGSRIDFSLEPPSITYFDIPLDFVACAMFSDADGNLLAYSNGCVISGANHEVLMNGDTINAGRIYNSYCDDGYPLPQGVTFIPVESSPGTSIFRLVHLWRNDDAYVTEIRYTELVYESYKDSVYIRDKDIIADVDLFTQDLTCTRHANGRDWWILQPLFESAIINKYISDPSGILKVGSQEIGNAWNDRDWSGQATFSPDGSKYARANPSNGLEIYDFDRCSGVLSNHVHIDFQNDTVFSSGVTFSPDSRYLYVSATLWVYQYDTWAPNIEESEVVVAEYDGFEGPFSTTFYHQMLAPNGKIYITAPNGVYYLHVIHEPNKKGASCNLEQHGVELPTRHAFSTPNFPHYRLGPLKDSPCDTLGIVSTHDLPDSGPGFTLYPNPASTEIYLSLDIPSTSTDDLVCTVLSMDGRTLLRIALDAPTERIDVRELPPGVYVACVSNRYGVVGQRRFVVM